ncbi:MAG TPA: hypothetical protein VG370_16635 [Chloroflexota bacterium]|nr:hypothetical protein [Chloroflexota bacterium]
MGTADWINMAVLSAHVVGAFTWLTLLAGLAGLSWGAYWSRDPALRQGLSAFRGRLLRPVWAVVVVLVATGIYNQSHNVPFPLPHPWELAGVAIPYGKTYVLLMLGKHIFVAQTVLGLAVVTWRLALTRPVAELALAASAGAVRGDPRSDAGAPGAGAPAAELGTALVGTLALASGVCVVLTASVLGYVHLLAHGH